MRAFENEFDPKNEARSFSGEGLQALKVMLLKGKAGCNGI
jgi:hypothetical protein